LGDLEVRVADHRVIGCGALGLLDVVGPSLVVLHRVHAQADDLGVALVELGLDARHVAQLGGAHRGEILGVREEDGPLIVDPLVEVDRTLGRLRSEVGGFVVDTQRHGTLLFAIGARYRNALWARTPPGPTGRAMGPDAVPARPGQPRDLLARLRFGRAEPRDFARSRSSFQITASTLCPSGSSTNAAYPYSSRIPGGPLFLPPAAIAAR